MSTSDQKETISPSSELADTWLDWYRKKEGQVEAEIPKGAELFLKNNVTSVLDIGCGTGRHSIFLAKKGFHASGFDQSESDQKS